MKYIQHVAINCSKKILANFPIHVTVKIELISIVVRHRTDHTSQHNLLGVYGSDSVIIKQITFFYMNSRLTNFADEIRQQSVEYGESV